MVGTNILRLTFKYQKGLWRNVYERLGPFEELILEVFKRLRYRNETEIYSVKSLCNIILNTKSYYSHYWLPPSIYKSVFRAVNSLERKGYLETEFYNDTLTYNGKNKRIKIIKIGPRMYEEKKWLGWYKRKIP